MTFPAGIAPDAPLTLRWLIENAVRAYTIPGLGGLVVDGDWFLCGWAFEETTGANPARLVLFDGRDTTAQQVMPITLKAGESTREWLGLPGLSLERGMFVSVTLGIVAGQVWMMQR